MTDHFDGLPPGAGEAGAGVAAGAAGAAVVAGAVWAGFGCDALSEKSVIPPAIAMMPMIATANHMQPLLSI
jgi:hypothetical protein